MKHYILYFILMPSILYAGQVQFRSFSKDLLPYKKSQVVTQRINRLSINVRRFKNKSVLSQEEKQSLKQALSNLQKATQAVETSYTLENLQKAKAAVTNLSLDTYSSINADDPLFAQSARVERSINRAIKEMQTTQQRIQIKQSVAQAPQPVVRELKKVSKIARTNRLFLKVKGIPTTNYRGYLKELKEFRQLIPVITQQYGETNHRKIKLALSKLKRRLRNIKRSLIILKKDGQFKENIQKMNEINQAIDNAIKMLNSHTPHK